MITLSEKDLIEFKTAIYKDYGIQIKDSQLYTSAFDLLSFFEQLTKHDSSKKVLKSSKTVSCKQAQIRAK